jgi:hypothetical protein
MTKHPSWWDWKRHDTGGDTDNVAAVLTSRIFPASAFASGSVEALASSLVGAVRNGVNLQVERRGGWRGEERRGEERRGEERRGEERALYTVGAIVYYTR